MRKTKRAILGLALSLLIIFSGAMIANAAIGSGSFTTGTTSGSDHQRSTSIILSKPSGVTDGDLLLAQIGYNDGSSVSTITPPSGWTLVVRGDHSGDVGQAVYWHAVTNAASEPASYTWTFSKSVQAAGGILRYTGVDITDPIIKNSTHSGSDDDLTASSLSGNMTNSMLVAMYTIDYNSSHSDFFNPPSGMTERYECQNPDTIRIMAADQPISVNGNTGDKTAHADDGDNYTAQLVALRMTTNYTVTYSSAHGTLSSSSESVARGLTPASVPTVTADPGWTFTGWYMNTGTTLMNSTQVDGTVISGTTTFTAQYSHNQYTVTFNLAGHGSSGNTLVFNPKYYGDSITPPVVTASSGWHFDGWYKDSGTTLLSNTDVAGMTVTGTTVFTAQYTHIPYTVVFHIAGPATTASDVTYSPVYFGDTITVPSVTTKPGWTFDGWDVTPVTTVAGSATYTAKYTHIPYTVAFHIAGPATTASDVTYSPVYFGDTITVPSVTTKPGWTFDGWDVTPVTTVAGSATYTAQYTHIQYTVAFHIAGPATTASDVTYSPVYFGDTITVPSVTTKPGWTFDGWDVTPVTTVAGSATYTAKYTHIPYTVAFHIAGPATTASDVTYSPVYFGDTITVPSVTTKPGWTFDGWDVTPVTTVAGSATYTAQYTHIQYTVAFHIAGPATTASDVTYSPVYYGDTITVPTVTTKPGWTFDGWNVTPVATVAGSATYTAQYTHVQYSVTFSIAGHGTTLDQLIFSPVYYGDSITAPFVTENHGWHFEGWYQDEDTTLLSSTVVNSMTVTGTTTFTAQYTQIPYTVTFVADTHGTLTGQATFTGLHYGDAFPTVPTPVPNADSYFVGWSAGFPATVTGNATFTATFALKTGITLTADSSTVTYNGVAQNVTTYTGLPGGLTISGVSVNTAATNAGTYPVNFNLGTVAIKQGATDVTSHYTVTYVPGTLTIQPKQAAIAIDNKAKVYGNADPALTAVVTGTAGADTLNYTLARAAGGNVGGYAITATLGANPNYTVNVTNGTLTITRRNATVAVDNKTKAQGSADPALTATVTGTVGNDVIAYTLNRDAGETTGSYNITAIITPNGNYNVTVTNGTLTIGAAPTTIPNPNVPTTSGPQSSSLLFPLIIGGIGLAALLLLLFILLRRKREDNEA